MTHQSGSSHADYDRDGNTLRLKSSSEVYCITGTGGAEILVDVSGTANVILDSATNVTPSRAALEIVNGHTNLELIGASEFTSQGNRAGIMISTGAGKSLTIDGSGEITAKGDGFGAGIGGGGDCGIITINGGTVNAFGNKGAGIGGSSLTGNSIGGTGGVIIINGGTVNASSNHAAGIGGGVGTPEGQELALKLAAQPQ